MNTANLIWWLGLVSVILTALANETGQFPTWLHGYIEMGSLLAGVVMAYLKQSPIPPKDNGTGKS